MHREIKKEHEQILCQNYESHDLMEYHLQNAKKEKKSFISSENSFKKEGI